MNRRMQLRVQAKHACMFNGADDTEKNTDYYAGLGLGCLFRVEHGRLLCLNYLMSIYPVDVALII
jgi:hypothetical protein